MRILSKAWGRFAIAMRSVSLAIVSRNAVTTYALVAIGIGCGMERLSLGLIVPGAIIFGCLAWTAISEARA